MHRRKSGRRSSGQDISKQQRAARDSAHLFMVETLEPRLLLSGSVSDPIINQDDFTEYLGSVGLGGLEQLDIQITMDVPEGYVSASAPEQLAAIGEAGLVAVGTQPQGALSGKIVYVHGGHGRYDTGTAWSWQRPLLLEVNEDTSNQDMMSYLVKFLWNAGATVVPLRPVGHQVNEIILDNDDTEVSFVGSWSNSSSTVFYGSPGDTPYRYASTSATETAYARYRPNVTEEGFYPVYAWTRSGSDRVNQLYNVTHSGGTTEVSVNHRRVGNGLVYLGTYHFETGTDGYVDISNRSNESGVVIADMIRFGNGMGDINLGHGTSGLPREDEPGVYWIAQNLGQGISTSEYGSISSTVSAPPRFAEFMNREADGQLSDRVFISYHSNAGSGSSRGTLGLVNGNNNPATATPNMFLLANTVSGEINDDLVALNGTFEHNWFNRSTHTLDRSDIEFGEINNNYINNEFDATIIEWAYHDNSTDTELMRDPKVRDAVARATYQGMQRYFNSVDGGATGLTFMPDAVSDLVATTNGDGTVTLDWTPPVGSAIHGGTPTGYMVYTSLNGYGFDGGTFVAGGATTSKVMTGLDSVNGTHYFKVVAVNAGGESLASPVVAATPLIIQPSLLIVNGFDRNDRNTNERYTMPGGTVDRVRLRYQNTGDYVVQVGEAIEAFNTGLGIDTAQNENIISGNVLLSDYDTVVWILGEESSANDTFNVTEQSLVAAFVAGGGSLFVSGAEIGWDLDNLNNGRTFYNDTLGADYVSDDAGTYNVQGAAGSIFAGVSLTFDDGTLFYDSEFPDRINPGAGAITAMTYLGGAGGGAAIQKQGIGGAGSIVNLAFPFETIVDAQDRADVMAAALTFFGTAPTENPGMPNGLIATPGNNTVALDWNDNVDLDLLGYDIQRATVSGGPYTTLNVTPVIVSQFTDNTAVNGTAYFYQVLAIDTDTNASAPSVEVSATPDDHGDDKDNATVVAVPSSTAGMIGSLSDSDWFELTLTVAQDYTFSVLADGLASGELRLYANTGSLLATDTGPASGGTLAELQYTPVASGVYYLSVESSGTGGYDLAVQEADDYGDTIPTAVGPLTSFAPGGIQSSGDVDMFFFTATAGMQYDIQMNDAGVPDGTLSLLDSGGFLVTQDSGSSPGGTHALIQWTATSSGLMYVAVSANPGSLGGYIVTLAESDPQIDGDLDGDGFVGIADLNLVLGNWNQSVTPGDLLAGDPDGDGFVGIADLNVVLGNWNAGTPPAATNASQDETTAEAQPFTTQPASTTSADDTPVKRHNNKTTRRNRNLRAPDAASRTDHANGLAIVNWRASGRSPFGDARDGHYTPAVGLWETDDDE